MDNINLDYYKLKEIIYDKTEEQRNLDEMIQYLQKIVMDRSIDERNKVDVHKQLKELIRLKSITMPMPKIVFERKEDINED